MSRSSLLLFAMVIAGGAHAQTATGVVNIDALRVGWNYDTFAIDTAQAYLNPANCPYPDGYATEKTLPGYQTFLPAALTAFSLDTPVNITIDNTHCTGSGRPKLIGIDLLQ